MSSSITPVFHQEMLRYHLKPAFEYQVELLLRQSKKTNRVRFGASPFGYKKLLCKLIMSHQPCEIYRMNHGKLTFGRKTKLREKNEVTREGGSSVLGT